MIFRYYQVGLRSELSVVSSATVRFSDTGNSVAQVRVRYVTDDLACLSYRRQIPSLDIRRSSVRFLR
jgi:hypothetical protein